MGYSGNNKWLFYLFLLFAGIYMTGANIRSVNVGESIQLNCLNRRVNSWQSGTNEFPVLCENNKPMINMHLQIAYRIKINSDCTILTITNVTKKDAGTYICFFAQNDKSKTDVYGKHEIHVIIRNSTVMQNQSVTLLANTRPRMLECNASGLPDNYNFSGAWKHYSYNYELIRSLDGDTNGSLILQNNYSENPFYEDSGIYTCSVSNGVLDEWGKLWNTQSINVTIEGKPVLAKPYKNTFTGYLNATSIISIFVLSSSNISRAIWTSRDRRKVTPCIPSMAIKEFYGKPIKTSGYICELRINKTTLKDFQNYEVDIENKCGENTFEVSLTLTEKPCFAEKPSIESQSYWTKFLLVLVIVIPVCIVITWWRLKKAKNSSPDNSHRENAERVQVEGGAIENNLYQAANDLIEQPSVSSNDAYSCIDKRKPIVHRQKVTYNISKQGKQTKKSDQTENREQHQSSMRNGMDNPNLNYSEVSFDNTTHNVSLYIHGADARTPYVDIDFSATADPWSSSEEDEADVVSVSSDNNDFVSLEEVQQWMICKE